MGLLSGKISRRSQLAVIAHSPSGVKTPGWPVVPVRAVGKSTKLSLADDTVVSFKVRAAFAKEIATLVVENWSD